MPDSVASVGGFKASGMPLEDYVRARNAADTPPGVSPYSAGMASQAYAGVRPPSYIDRLTELSNKAREGITRLLGLGGKTQPISAPMTLPRTDNVQVGSILSQRTPVLETQLNALERRSTTPTPTIPPVSVPPPTPNLFSVRR